MSAARNVIVVRPDASVVAVYDDGLQLHQLGPGRIRRASHVEPGDDGLWWADMGPVGGPVLGPYDLRADALAAEIRWLHTALEQGDIIA